MLVDQLSVFASLQSTSEERVELIRQVCRHYPNVEVTPFANLTVRFVRDIGAGIMLRGLRTLSDMEYEFNMSLTNANLDPEIETVFLMADPRHQAIASRLVKEIASFGGNVSAFTTPAVASALKKRYAKGRK